MLKFSEFLDENKLRPWHRPGGTFEVQARKMFRQRKKTGELSPLFANSGQRIVPGKWYPAENHPPTKLKVAERPGWHAPFHDAPHIKRKLKSGEKRVVGDVTLSGDVYDVDVINRPKSQGGQWWLFKPPSGRMRLNKVKK